MENGKYFHILNVISVFIQHKKMIKSNAIVFQTFQECVEVILLTDTNFCLSLRSDLPIHILSQRTIRHTLCPFCLCIAGALIEVTT